MTTQKKKPTYKGLLAKKLPRVHEREMTAALVARDNEAFGRAFQAQYELKLSKLELLLAHYDIEVEHDALGQALTYQELAVRLAEECVPGFQVEGERGRPQKWNYTLRMRAAKALFRLSDSHPGEPDSKVAIRLHKIEPWNHLSRSPSALLKQIRKLNEDSGHAAEEFIWDGRRLATPS